MTDAENKLELMITKDPKGIPTLKLLSGISGVTSYNIEATTNLAHINWTTVATNINVTNGWTDTNASKYKDRFYRAMQVSLAPPAATNTPPDTTTPGSGSPTVGTPANPPPTTGSVELRWNPPENPTNTFTGYMLSYWAEGQSPSTAKTNYVPSTYTTATISGLATNSNYQASMLSYNTVNGVTNVSTNSSNILTIPANKIVPTQTVQQDALIAPLQTPKVPGSKVPQQTP